MKVYCCGEVLESNFCPNCGGTMEKAIENKETPFPYTFKTYLHGEKEYGVAEKLGIEERSKLWDNIVGCAYEICLEWEITEDEQLNLIKVDGERVISNEDYELLQEYKNSL
ncbi:MAG: hypothetical protein SLAVMIC_00030 [uncultured marine phage]|uniref:Uncharacterized protein n=1 Tax=uncultured marine phage TaxID=707152 RepID=A0A8D9C9A5_9VIRU|nr:MAG: hypothetical protein SLAVMIC_00030 [uncultured marine phage]